MRLDAFASKPHYAAHLGLVWGSLPSPAQGAFARGRPEASERPVLTASFSDQLAARRAGYTRFVVMEHGAGQSYTTPHPGYPGGIGRDAELFLAPNEHSAGRWRAAYPRARVEVIGSPRLDALPAREPGPPTIAVSFHWNHHGTSEMKSALPHYRNALAGLAGEFNLIGHAHPRAGLETMYRRLGIEYVADFDEVCRRADLYIVDNSSTLFEFASTGRPVVVLNAPWYRREVRHGLRFWDAANVGLSVDQPELLIDGVYESLADGPAQQTAREAALAIVYAYRHGAAERASAAILDALGAYETVAA